MSIAIEKFHMLPDVFLASVTSAQLEELKAYFILENEDQELDRLANKSRAEAQTRKYR